MGYLRTGRSGDRLWALTSLIIIATLVISCASAPTPTPAPAPAPKTAEKAAPKPTEAKPAPTQAAPATPAAAAKPAAAAPAAALPKTINIATHNPGTVLNAQGTAMAKVGSDEGPIKIVVQPFQGPPAWVPGMDTEGKPEIGLINAVEARQAFTGKVTPNPLPKGVEVPQSYKTPFTKIRGLLYVPPVTGPMLVRNDFQGTSLPDLKGKRVTFGFPAMPILNLITLSNLVLGGLTIDDIKTVNVPETTAGQQALVENRVDATTSAVGMGTVAEADAKVGVRFLQTPIDAAKLKQAQGIMPGAYLKTFEPGPPGLKQKTDVWAWDSALLTSTHLSDDAAYSLVKGFWDNIEKIRPLHPNFKEWSAANFVNPRATIPYHPGAVKFYKERNMWTSEMEANQAGLLKGELLFLK